MFYSLPQLGDDRGAAHERPAPNKRVGGDHLPQQIERKWHLWMNLGTACPASEAQKQIAMRIVLLRR